jgi:hypothetical protein
MSLIISETMLNYLRALEMAYLVRGFSTEALEDTFVKAGMCGAINKESLTQKCEQKGRAGI